MGGDRNFDRINKIYRIRGRILPGEPEAQKMDPRQRDFSSGPSGQKFSLPSNPVNLVNPVKNSGQSALGHQRLRGGDGIGRLRDGPADDEMIRTALQSLRGRERPLLVLHTFAGRAHAGGDELDWFVDVSAD